MSLKMVCLSTSLPWPGTQPLAETLFPVYFICLHFFKVILVLYFAADTTFFFPIKTDHLKYIREEHLYLVSLDSMYTVIYTLYT